jgi:pimeloyl-ACP methyl ester carboxylesterase
MLFVGGEESEFYLRHRDRLSTSALAEDFRNARFALVKEAGHMLHWEQPQQLARLINEFLETVS